MTGVPSLSDEAVARLREALARPDLDGTKYRLLGRAGSGGMGTVFEAEDETLGRRVALKVLDFDDASGSLAERLRREARVLARLEHPGIVPIHDVGTLPDGRPFYAMKLVQGERLDRFAASLATRAERLRLFLRVAEPVAFAHARGVLHRDLKPENVMVGPFGEVLVLDWGLAKVLGDAEPAGAVLGTPGSMAPEQARGEEVDVRADVFALGALLAFLAGPAKPLPRALAAIVGKASAERPEARYPDVLSLARDVAAFLDGEPVTAHREGFLAKAGRLAVRHRVALLLVLAYLVTRAAVLLVIGR